MYLRDSLIPKYSEPVYNGFGFSPERETLQAARHRNATRRHRSRARQTVQRQYHRCPPQKFEESLRSKDRNDGRQRVDVRPERRDRIRSI